MFNAGRMVLPRIQYRHLIRKMANQIESFGPSREIYKHPNRGVHVRRTILLYADGSDGPLYDQEPRGEICLGMRIAPVVVKSKGFRSSGVLTECMTHIYILEVHM